MNKTNEIAQKSWSWHKKHRRLENLNCRTFWNLVSAGVACVSAPVSLILDCFLTVMES